MSPVIVRIMKKELFQTFRDPRMLMLIAPILHYAVTLDLTAQPTVIADLDRTA